MSNLAQRFSKLLRITLEWSMSCQLCQSIREQSGLNDVGLSDYEEISVVDDFSLTYSIFHSECTRCSTIEAEKKLCDSCRHFRLHHLMICIPEAGEQESELVLELGTLDDFTRTQDCELHELARIAIDAFLLTLNAGDECWHSAHFRLGTSCSDPVLWLAGFIPNRRGIPDCEDETFEAFHATTVLTKSEVAPLTEIVDWSLIKSWLHRCERDHQHCKQKLHGIGSAHLPIDFRVIDLENDNIVRPSHEFGLRYVALSYTWGRNQGGSKALTLLSNIQDFEKSGGLVSANLPVTVKQAIQACRSLGERYLWVDRLCIIQDDVTNKQMQIAGMAAIYNSASLTVVIAHGEGMEVSLPGIGHRRSYTTASYTVGDLRVQSRLPTFEDAINRSFWASRGWTY